MVSKGIMFAFGKLSESFEMIIIVLNFLFQDVDSHKSEVFSGLEIDFSMLHIIVPQL